MCSRAFLLLGLFAATLLLISSAVVARDLAQTSTEKQNGELISWPFYTLTLRIVKIFKPRLSFMGNTTIVSFDQQKKKKKKI